MRRSVRSQVCAVLAVIRGFSRFTRSTPYTPDNSGRDDRHVRHQYALQASSPSEYFACSQSMTEFAKGTYRGREGKRSAPYNHSLTITCVAVTVALIIFKLAWTDCPVELAMGFPAGSSIPAGKPITRSRGEFWLPSEIISPGNAG